MSPSFSISIRIRSKPIPPPPLHLGNQSRCIVNTLTTRQDLLSADKDIKRVGDLRSLRNVIVGLQLLLDHSTKGNLVLGSHVFVLIQHVTVLVAVARLVQHTDCLRKWNDRGLIKPYKILAGKLTLDHLHLGSVLCVDILKDSFESAVKHTQQLVVVRLNCHLQIQTSELRQMSVRVAVLSTEDRTNLHDTPHVSSDSHLLAQLWRLRKERRTAKVVQFEHTSARFRCYALQLRNAGLDLEDCLRSRGAQVDDAVALASSVRDTVTSVTFLISLGLGNFGFMDSERQRLVWLRLNVHFVDVHLNIMDRDALPSRGSIVRLLRAHAKYPEWLPSAASTQ
ncbi:aspartyl-tRNA synthetase [Hortaea werneckii]|nr:aspartyl-tRNA synthetase [Hortaea werneckii]